MRVFMLKSVGWKSNFPNTPARSERPIPSQTNNWGQGARPHHTLTTATVKITLQYVKNGCERQRPSNAVIVFAAFFPSLSDGQRKQVGG